MKSVIQRSVLLSLSVCSSCLIGCGSGTAPAGGSSAQPAPTLASISPSSATAGSLGMVLTATGSNFVPGSEITWNGTERATLYVSSSTLQMNLATSDLASAANVQVGVTDPQDVGGANSNTLTFTIASSLNPNPVPVLSSISPASASAGASATTVSLTGSNFIPGSEVTWNGQTLVSSYLNATSLTATIPAADLQTPGNNALEVINPMPGGGTSAAVTFVVNAVGSVGQSIINLPANDLAWDSAHQVMYLSLPSSTGPNGNTVQILNPVTGTLGASTFAGSEPDLLSISSSGKYLYASLDGSSSLQRFLLPGLTPDINISFGSASFYGAYVAMDVEASPAADGTVAFVLGTPGTSPEEEGGVHIFDDSVQRPNALCGFIQFGCTGNFGDLFDSIQWSSTATEMYALNNEDTGFDYYQVPVTAQGFGSVTDYGALSPGFGADIHYDAPTNLVYTDYGNVINPATGAKVGEFNASGIAVPDGKNGVIYFIGQPLSAYGSSTYTIESFDIHHFTPIATLTVQNVIGSPTHFIRWGTNGLAFTTYNYLYGLQSGQQEGAVYLISGSFVASASKSPEPVPENVHLSWKPVKPLDRFTRATAPASGSPVK